MEEIFICPFCGRNDFKSKSGLTRHVKSCKSNPDRVEHSNKGKPKSEEHKQKLSETHKGKKHSDETKQKISEAGKIAQNRPEVKQKISDAGKKRFEDPEERRKQSERLKGEKNPWYGKHHTEESKQKMSESLKGRRHTEETKQKLSKANKGKYTGEKHPFYGKHHTEESKRKISEAGKIIQNRPEVKQKNSESQKIAQNRPEVKQKQYETKKQNNSFNTSKIEEQLKDYLISHNINFKTQYKSDLYPFMCDFYFPDKDLYVEIQGCWTHGGKPYNETDQDCITQLELWKSKNTKYYDKAIETWTVRDVNKRNIAKQNNLNLIEIFSIDLDECIQKISERITIYICK